MFIDREKVILTQSAVRGLENDLAEYSPNDSMKCLIQFSRLFETIDGNEVLIAKSGFLIGEYNVEIIPDTARIPINNFMTAVYVGENAGNGHITIDYSDGKYFLI